MTGLNRAVAPITREIKRLDFPVCDKTSTPNGIPVYSISSATEQVMRVEIVFNAGIVKQHQKLIASAVNSLLTEGTSSKSAKEIADTLDFYGSYVQPRCMVDDAQITLYCLKKHLQKCLDVLLDIISNPLFPENELSIYKKNSKQRLKVQQEKTGYLCRKAYYLSVFGKDSPIAYYSESEDYDVVSRETLSSFFATYYKNQIKYITICGDVDTKDIHLLCNSFSDFHPSSDLETYTSKVVPESHKIQKANSAQTTLRVGKRLFNRTHADYRKLQLLNLVLGGYFGSRLMKNIREDKGLTYGIYSVLESYLDDGCFYIEADVNTKKVDLALREIKNELITICENPIDQKELDTAKNYFLGSILRGIDGPFSIMDRNRILIDYGFNNTYYDELVEIIKATSPAELLNLSNKYFNPESVVQIVCGG